MIGNVPTQPQSIGKLCESERPTVMVELQRRRDRAVKQLEDIDTAIRLFTEQPALEQALTSIGRLGISL